MGHISAARIGETPSSFERASFDAAPSTARPASLNWHKGEALSCARGCSLRTWACSLSGCALRPLTPRVAAEQAGLQPHRPPAPRVAEPYIAPADLASGSVAAERQAVLAEHLERLAGARACQLVDLLRAEGAHVRQLRQPLERKLLAPAHDVLLEAPRAAEHGRRGAGVLERLVVGVLVLLVRVVVALDRDLELLKQPQLLDDPVLDVLGVGQRICASQRQLHGASCSIARWRGEGLGLLRRAETEALLLTALLPVVVVRLVARVTTTGRGHAARQPASRPELATDARVAARDRQVVHLARRRPPPRESVVVAPLGVL